VVAEHGERVAVGLDVAGGLLRPRGGGRPVGAVMSMLDRLNRAGVARYVVTDVARDGRMAGPNLDLLVRVCASTEAAVLASGGVATLDDLRALCALAGHGLTGVIVGQALHVGAFTVAEALHALQPVATA
jgi:phosphoribosylanthranilate isomerase